MNHISIAVALSLLAFGGPLAAVASTLVAGEATFQGSVARVPLTFGSGGGATGALQWTTLVPGAASVSVQAGPAATAAGKSVQCNSGGACILAGTTLATIGSGVVATVVVDVSNNPTATFPLQLSNPMEALADGSAGQLAVTGGSIVPPPPVTPARLSAFACSLSVIVPGGSTVCTLSMSSTAGGVVPLTSSSATVPVPAGGVSIPTSALSATFTVTASATAPDHPALLTASFGGVSKQVTVTVRAPTVVSGFACSPASLRGGEKTTCTVTISNNAGEFPFPVALSSGNAALLPAPPAFSIPSWTTSAAFSATAAGTIPADQTVTLTAGGKSAVIQLLAPAVLSSLSCAAAQIAPKASTTCTVRLASAAPAGGRLVSVSTTGQGLTIPTGVRVQAGLLTRAFTVTAAATAPAQTASIVASVSAVDRVSVALRVAAAATAVSGVRLSCAPRAVFAGMEGTCTVTLREPVSDTGAVTLGLDGDGAFVPADVTIPAGADSASFRFATSTVVPVSDALIAVRGTPAAEELEIAPPPEFYLRGHASEFTGGDRRQVRPSLTPAGLLGSVAGGVQPAAVDGDDGLEFGTASELHFDGRQAGPLFSGESGEVSFLLRLKAPPPGRVRRLVHVFDGRRSRLWMAMLSASGGDVVLVYSAGQTGANQRYAMPAPGADPVAVRLQWSPEGHLNLYVNDALVQTGSYSADNSEWLDTSRLTIGPLAEGDGLARFLVRRRAGAAR